jgi:hypothetical protein
MNEKSLIKKIQSGKNADAAAFALVLIRALSTMRTAVTNVVMEKFDATNTLSKSDALDIVTRATDMACFDLTTLLRL